MNAASRRSAGGIEGATKSGTSEGVGGQPDSSAADVRRTIVVALGGDKQLTPDEVERAVNLKLPHARHSLVTSQLRVLQDGEYVEPVEGNSRQLALTVTGKRWLSGIRALSGSRLKASS